jgi:hypothetical protein
MEFIPSEKAMPIRNPATANLLIDSRDRQSFGDAAFAVARPDQTSANFTINKTNSIMNGYFTRIAPTEVNLDWCVDNINQYWDNALLRFLPSTLTGAGVSTITVGLPNGQYNVAQTLQQTISSFNSSATASTGSLTLSTIGVGGTFRGGEVSLQMFSTATVIPYQVVPDNLAIQLDLQGTAGSNVSSPSQTAIGCPKLLPTSFIDFASQNLTYNQNLKDATTSMTTNDILFRWYLSDTVPNSNDVFGYPIYQGYKRFIQRREVTFPKQINWKANQPIGQLSFQVLDDQGRVLPSSLIGSGTTTANLSELEWQMTCLVSEV